MKDWSDGKKFLFDHIIDAVLYGSILLASAFLDPILNFLHSAGLNINDTEPFGHPYKIGAYQAVAAVFAALQLIRLIQKLNQWKYYS